MIFTYKQVYSVSKHLPNTSIFLFFCFCFYRRVPILFNLSRLYLSHAILHVLQGRPLCALPNGIQSQICQVILSLALSLYGHSILVVYISFNPLSKFQCYNGTRSLKISGRQKQA